MADIWNKLDDLIYDLRWYLATALLGLAMIGGGTYLLTNGEQPLQSNGFRLPAANSPLPSPEQIAGENTPTGPININTATAAELETLSGIGPTLAERIVDYRERHGPFKTKEELKEVKGIGDKTFADLEDEITIE